MTKEQQENQKVYLRERAIEFAMRNKPSEYMSANVLTGKTEYTRPKYDLLAEAKKIEKYLKTGK